MENTINSVSMRDKDSNKVGIIQKDLEDNDPFESYLKAIGRDKNQILQDNSVDKAVEKLALSFGIGKTFMYAILQSLNIKPEDLLDETKSKLIEKKLQMYFGIDKKKEEALNDLMSIKKRRIE